MCRSHCQEFMEQKTLIAKDNFHSTNRYATLPVHFSSLVLWHHNSFKNYFKNFSSSCIITHIQIHTQYIFKYSQIQMQFRQTLLFEYKWFINF